MTINFLGIPMILFLNASNHKKKIVKFNFFEHYGYKCHKKSEERKYIIRYNVVKTLKYQ